MANLKTSEQITGTVAPRAEGRSVSTCPHGDHFPVFGPKQASGAEPSMRRDLELHLSVSAAISYFLAFGFAHVSYFFSFLHVVVHLLNTRPK
jgi:hypothetical protein